MGGHSGLFKYLSPGKLDFFENREVLLTPPIYLNDPWDFLPKGRNASDEEVLKSWKEVENEISKSSVIHVPAGFLHRQKAERLQKLNAWAKSREFADGLPAFSRNKFSSTFGIVSLTEKPLCRLMWAHYAESHAGFVAEFATHDPFVAEDGRACRSCINKPAGKVEYPLSFKLEPWSRDNITTACWTKHPEWKYEHEWRILWLLNEVSVVHKESRFRLKFAPKDLVRVIFGMRMRSEAKRKLQTMLNRDEFAHVQKQTTEIDSKTGDLILKRIA